MPRQDLANARSGASELTLVLQVRGFRHFCDFGCLVGLLGSTPSNEFDASLSLRGSGLGSESLFEIRRFGLI